jgi:predicted amidohydrolase
MSDERSFVLAGLRVTAQPWDKAGNVDALARYAGQAAADGADLVVTPEGFVEGYVWSDDAPTTFSMEQYFELGESIDGALMSRVRELAHQLAVYLAVGFAERRDDRMFNSLAIISPDGTLLSVYAKTHTAGDEPFNTKGMDFPVIDTGLGRWGTLVCMDRQLPETARILALKGAQLILVPAWGMTGELNDAMMRTRAYENGVHVAFVHPRRCLIIDPSGTILAEDTGGCDEIVSARITLRKPGLGPIRRRRPEIYGELLLPSPLAPDPTAES